MLSLGSGETMDTSNFVPLGLFFLTAAIAVVRSWSLTFSAKKKVNTVTLNRLLCCSVILSILSFCLHCDTGEFACITSPKQLWVLHGITHVDAE